MTKPKDYHSALHWIVEVHTTGPGGGQWWEPIAGFNVAVAAQNYANQCSQNGLNGWYRVTYAQPPTPHKSYVVYETQPKTTLTLQP